MDITPDRWRNTAIYLRHVFGREDDALASIMPAAVAAGLPDIAISPDVGRLLMILVQLATRGHGQDARTPRTVLEIGTLAGYSTIWLARALPPGGRVITIDIEPGHLAFARERFKAAKVADRIETRPGGALGVLPGLARELGPESIDAVFLDAAKAEYLDYARLCKPLLRRGGLLLADNTLGSGSWWIDDPPGAHPERDAIDAFNRAIAADPDFDAACVPIRQGVLIARKR